METRASYILVGSFVLLFLAGMVGAVLWLAGVDLDEEVALYDVYFDGSISGLKEGNAVRYRGVPIGSVKTIDISRENVEQIQVTVEVRDGIPIKEDAIASLEYQGITGVAFIQLSGGTNAAPLLTARAGQDRPVITSKQSQLEQLFEQAPELMQRFIGLVDRASLILSDDNVQAVSGVLSNLDSFSGALSNSSDDVRDILAEASGTLVQLRATMGEAETLLAAFSNRSERLAELTEETMEDASAVIDTAVAAMENIEVVTKDARDMMGEIRPMVAATQGTLGTINEAAAQMRDRIPEVTSVIGDAMEKTAGAAAVLKDVADPFAARADSLAATSETAIGEASKLMVRARDGIGSAESFMATGEDLMIDVKPAIKSTGAAMEDVAAMTRDLRPHVGPLAKDADLTLREFASIAQDLKLAASNIANAAGSASELLEDNKAPLTEFANNGLFEFTQLITELRVLATSLGRVSSQIEQDPARFFFGDSQQGFEAQ